MILALAALLATIGLVPGAVIGSAQPASALAGSSFDPGFIISDSLFYDAQAMTTADIQSFLNARIGSCRNGLCLNVATLTHPGAGTRVSSSTGNVICQPITGGSMSASEWIYRVQVACGISAKVILATLQKEQGLVTSQAPSSWALQSAMGMACPDTAPCDTAYSGLATQIYEGTRQLKTYKAAAFGRQPGTHFITYHPNSACGGTQVTIQNYATAALYNYTPYQPNTAALSNLYGIGDSCSSYGNRNFWRLYNDWFGPTTYTLSGPIGSYHAALPSAAVLLGPPTANAVCGLRDSGCYQRFQYGLVHWSSASGAHRTDGEIQARWSSLGWETGVLGYPITDAGWSSSGGGGYVQQFQGGAIQWTSEFRAVALLNGAIRSAYIAEGYQAGWLGWPREGQEAGPGGVWQRFQGATLYAKSGTSIAVPVSDAMRLALSGAGGVGVIGWPTAKEVCSSGVCEQEFERGVLTADGSSTKYPIGAEIRTTWLANSTEVGLPLGYYSASTVNGGGYVQQFANGAIHWTSRNGPVIVFNGPIRSQYVAQGWQAGALGWPKSDRVCDSLVCEQAFDNGVIVQPVGTTKAYRLDGEILAAWRVARADLGAPLSVAGFSAPNGGGYVQQFQNGAIQWTARNRAVVLLDGPIRSQYVAQGWQAGALGWPKSDRVCDSLVCEQAFDNGVIAQPVGASSAYRLDGEILAAWRANAALGAPVSNAQRLGATGYVQNFVSGQITWDPVNRAVARLS